MNKEQEIHQLEGQIARWEQRRADALQRANDLLHDSTSRYQPQTILEDRRMAASLAEHIALARERIAALREPWHHRTDRPETPYLAGSRMTL